MTTQNSSVLRTVRKSRRLSQPALAFLAKVSLSSVVKAESGAGVLRKRTRKKIAAALGFPPEVVFGDRPGDES
jgi:transcriptional regulator with XRE-family HTH domain